MIENNIKPYLSRNVDYNAWIKAKAELPRSPTFAPLPNRTKLEQDGAKLHELSKNST